VTFTEDQIKAAFWKMFHGAGSMFFDYRGNERENNDSTNTHWCEFLDHLGSPSEVEQPVDPLPVIMKEFPMTDDFIQDGIDSLQADPDYCYILVAGHFGRPECITAARVPTADGLAWIRRRLAELTERIEKQNALPPPGTDDAQEK
jgi:hypothetical protein